MIWSVFFLFLFLCRYQSCKAVPDVSEKLFLSWSFYNRVACLGRVSCSSEQKSKWCLWERKLWKRTRWWIVSNKNLLGIYLWWVYILCFLKFSIRCHANSVPLILEFWNAFTKVFATPQINSVECPEMLFYISIVFCHRGECRSLRYCLLGSEDPFYLRRFHNTPTFLNPHTSSRELNSSIRQWMSQCPYECYVEMERIETSVSSSIT